MFSFYSCSLVIHAFLIALRSHCDFLHESRPINNFCMLFCYPKDWAQFKRTTMDQSRSLERGSDRSVDRLIFSSRRLVASLLPVAGGSDSLLWPEASQKFSPVIETNSTEMRDGRLMALYTFLKISAASQINLCFFPFTSPASKSNRVIVL